MNLSDIHKEDRLIHLPSDTLCIVTDRDDWSVNIFHSHSAHTAKVNTTEGLSLYKEA